MKKKKFNRTISFVLCLWVLLAICLYFYCFKTTKPPYVCPGYMTIVKPNASPSLLNPVVDTVKVPYVCNQLVIDNQHPNYNIWRERLLEAGYGLIDSCQCTSGIELWESPTDVDAIGVIKDPPPDAESIGDGRPSYNFVFSVPTVDTVSLVSEPPKAPVQPKCNNQPVKIAVVDSGLDTSMNKNILRLPDFNWKAANMPAPCSATTPPTTYGINKLNIVTEPSDQDGHGTHVMGIIIGVAKNDGNRRNVPFEVLNVKFIENNTGSLFHGLCGLYFALRQNVDIINISWGYLDDIYDSESLGPPVIFKNFLVAAERDSVLVVAGVGNDSTNLTQRYQFWPSGFANEHPNLIAVGAITNIVQGDRAGFSNWTLGENMTLVAPGVEIQSAFPRYLHTGTSEYSISTMSGTSMATPFVTQTAAVLKGLDPDLGPLKIKNILIKHSTKKGGYHILNHEAAVNAVGCYQ